VSDEVGSEDGEFSHPVLESRGRDDDEMRTFLSGSFEVSEESDNLSSLSETY